jgi:hypothetical protein
VTMCVMLVKGTSPFARRIQNVTGSQYSHSAFADLESNCTYEADFPRVMSRQLDTYAWEYGLYRIKDLTPDRETALRKWCQERVGRWYDFGKVLGLAVQFLFSWTGLRPVLDHRSAYYCAEYNHEGLESVGILLQADPTSVVPGHLEHDPALEPMIT